PHVDEESLKALFRGIWRNHDDGPEVWRRSVYIYQKRALPFPMVNVFDLPDQSLSFGARYKSTVPTQALTLMNDDFVIRQAQLFADRIQEAAPRDAEAQIRAAYAIALSRPPTEGEMRLALDFLQKQKLVDFAHVMLNLNEFVYMR